MPARAPSSFVGDPDWSIAWELTAPGVIATRARRDITVARQAAGQYRLTLGSGGVDFAHMEVSLWSWVVGGLIALDWRVANVADQTVWDFFLADDAGQATDPDAIGITIRRIPMGGE